MAETEKKEDFLHDINDINWRTNVNNALIEMIKRQSKICLDGYMLADSKEQPLNPQAEEIPVYGFWLTLVLLSTEHMHIILKTHFNFSTLEPVLHKLFNNQSVDITVEMGESFMNEFSNLFGTKIKNSLHQIGITTGMSLPLLTRGFDNYFFEENFLTVHEKSSRVDNADHYHIKDVWSYKAEETQFIYSVEIDIMSPTTYHKLSGLIDLNKKQSEDSSVSQLEFL